MVQHDGTPFFWMGDTAWQLFVKLDRRDAALYLEDRARRGFTVIQAGIITWDGNIPNAYGHRAFDSADVSRPNDAYFRHVDAVIDMAAQQGLHVGFLPVFLGNRSLQWLVDRATAYTYGRWLGARYRSKQNILWVLGGDITPDYEPADVWRALRGGAVAAVRGGGVGDIRRALGLAKRLVLGVKSGGGPTGVWRALAKGIAVGVTGSEDYTRTIMTYHACGSPCVFHGDPWFSLNMIEVYEDPARVYPAVSRDYHATPTKPTGIGEGFYENDNDGPGTPTGTAYDVRREAYWSFLAGGYYTYGARPIFFFGGGWQRALDLPGARHMSIRRRLLTSRPWWTFVPDQGILARGEGSGDTLNAAARSADGRSIIVYLSHPSVVSVNMGKITGRHMVKAQWFDPGSGRRTDAGVFPNTGTRSFFTPRGWRDAILLLDVASPA